MNSHLDESVFSLQHGDTFNPNHNISNNAEQALPDLSAFVEEVPPLESFFGTPSPSAYGPPENAHLLPEKQPPKTLFLFIEQGPAANQAFQIVQGNCIIGRASIVDLCLQHPSVSRRHAQLKRSGNSLYVRDLGSQNGTYVNQQRIANEAEIFAGDSIIIGTSLLRLWDSLPPENAVAEKAPADSTPAQNSRASSYYAVLIASLTAVFTLLLAMLVLKFTHPPTQTTPPLHPTPPMAASLAPSEETAPSLRILPPRALPKTSQTTPQTKPAETPPAPVVTKTAEQPPVYSAVKPPPPYAPMKASKNHRPPLAKKSPAPSKALQEKRRSIDEAFGDF